MRALALLVVLCASTAAAYPIPRGERALAGDGGALFGALAVDGPRVVVSAAPAPRSLFLAARDAVPDDVPFLRARLTGGTTRDVVILVRATATTTTADAFVLKGYGFFVDGDDVGFVRFDGARTDDPGARARIPGLAARGDVEIVLFLAGANLAALVFDGRTKESLAQVLWSDVGPHDGGVGFLVGRRQSPALAVTLSIPGPPVPEESRRDPIAAEWTVRIPRGSALPDDVRRHFRRVERDSASDTYITREVGVVVLGELGIPTLLATPGVAGRLRDPTFAPRHARALRATKTGVAFVDGLKDHTLVERTLRAYATRFPKKARLLELGPTREGRTIYGLRISDRLDVEDRPGVLLVGGHHADEVITPEPPLDAVRFLLEGRDPRIPRWLRAFTFVVIPLVNPDGNHAFWHVRDDLGRTNGFRDDDAVRLDLRAVGVDLNRNYPFRFANVEDRFNSSDPASRFFRGASPASEPEVQAVMGVAEALRPVVAVSYHAAATRILVPYTVDGAGEPSPSIAWQVASEMVEVLPEAMRGRRYQAVRNLYPVGGTDQDWLMHRFGTLAYLVELPVRRPRAGVPLDDVLERSRPIWTFLLDRYLEGPTLAVHATPAPDTAVSIDEVTWPNGERFTLSPRTGRYYTMLPGPGRYHVRLSSADGATRVEEVVVGRGVTVLDVEPSPEGAE